MKLPITESDFKKIYPVGDNVLIIKDDDEARSAGGVIIPDKHQEYKRRGWVLAVGGGCRTRDGRTHLPPYEPGDYLVADRAFVRPDEQEDELFGSPTILLIRGDEPLGFIRRADCRDGYRLPEKYQPILDQFAFKPQID